MRGHAATPAAGGTFVVPASYAQERVWFASQMARDVPLYHVIDELRLPYALSIEGMRDALARVCERHETLRTSFRLDGGALVQVVHPRVDLAVGHLDLTTKPGAEGDRVLRELIVEYSHAEFSLADPPLWKAMLVERGEADWVLLFVAHHTIVDAASDLNLQAELNELCAAMVHGREPKLPDLPIQYADFAMWQRDRLAGGRLDELMTFWRRELADLPGLHSLPTDLPRPAQRSFAGADIVFPLTDDINEGVPGLARGGGATQFMVLLAAYAALIHRLSGSADIVVGVPVAGRDEPEVQPLIGMFVNMVVARIDVGGDPTFAELLDRVRTRLLAVWDHQDMPFQKLVEALATHRLAGVPPLYQLGFNYLDVGFSGRSSAAEDDLLLEISNGLGRLEYNTALFTEATAGKMIDGYLRVLSAAVADPSVRISALPAIALPAIALPAIALPAIEVRTDADAGTAVSLADVGTDFVAPRTAAEELVADVWVEVLGVPRVGAFDNFFDLGGHSLLALRVIARISAAVEIDLPIQAFFADTTVAGVAAQVERLLLAELDEMPEPGVAAAST